VAKFDRIDPSGMASIRASLRLSQPQFARLLGVGVGTLRHWEQWSVTSLGLDVHGRFIVTYIVT